MSYTFAGVVSDFWDSEYISAYREEIEVLGQAFCDLPIEVDDNARAVMFGNIINAVFNMGRDSVNKPKQLKRLTWLSREVAKNWPDEED